MRQNETIDLSELRKLSDRLFDRLERNGIHQVGVKGRDYWTIFADEAFNVDKVPELVIGDVFDDMRDIRKNAEAPEDEAIAFWHAFHHLSGLMLFLANADMRGDFGAGRAEGDLP